MEIKKAKTALSMLRSEINVIGSNTSSLAALNEIVQLKPDLVVSDLRMEQMGGIGLMGALKTAGVDCGFVILTHSWSTEAMRDFFHAGGLDFLQKPLSTQSIATVLERLSARKHGYERLGAAT